MTFNEIMNSPLLYGLVGLGIAYIILFCLITLKKAYKHALELGITKEKLKLVITSSAIYSVVPSISIVIGLFSLASVLGAAARKRIGWWGSMPRAFSPSSITAP